MATIAGALVSESSSTLRCYSSATSSLRHFRVLTLHILVRSKSKKHDGAGTDMGSSDFIFDTILISSFLLMVICPFLVTLCTKVMIVQRTMESELLVSNENVTRLKKLT